MQAASKVVQKQEKERWGGRRDKVLPEGRERVPGSGDHQLQRSRCHVFTPTRAGIDNPYWAREDREFPKTKEVLQLLGNILKVPILKDTWDNDLRGRQTV